MEIDENLQRAELSPAEEALHIKRRKEVWAQVQAETVVGGRISPTNGKRKDGRKKGAQHERKFAAEVASVVGGGRNAESVKRDVNLKIRRAEELGSDLAKIAGTSLDKGVEMDALIKLKEPERSSILVTATFCRGSRPSSG